MNTSQKRKPFGEAPRDISNRTANPVKNAMIRSLSGRQVRSAAPPMATVQTKGKSRSSAAAGSADSQADAKTRQYKAQAYSDKITIASQTQRIEALRAELEEVRLFASLEKNTTESIPSDGELIEALAQELESTEADLKSAQTNVERLEMELQSERKRNAVSNKSVETASTSASSTGNSCDVAELNRVIERQNAELEKAKRDADEGVSIMRDLEKALRAARKERDASRVARDEALGALDDMKKQMEGMDIELSTGNQQVEVLEKRCGEMKEEYSVLQTRYSNLEVSLNELQNVLSVVQSRSEKKSASMNQALAESEEREEKSLMEYQTLVKKYDEAQRQCGEMEGVLSDITAKFEEMKAEVVSKEEELEMAEARHATNIEVIKEQYEKEAEAKQSAAKEKARVLYEAMLSKKESEYLSAMNEMQMQYQKQLREKDQLLTAREKQWESKSRDSSDQEAQELKAMVEKLEKANQEAKSALVERDEALSRIRNENSKLKTEKANLVQKLEKGVAMYNETVSQLKAKTAEAATAVPNKTVELVAANKALKKDLTSAVESSISRGKKIQAMEKEIESYQLKLNKANQKIKHMEKSVPSAISSDEVQRLETEIGNLRSRAEEAEREKQLLEQRVVNLDNLTKTSTDEKRQLESQLQSLSEKGRVAEETMSNMTKEISALTLKASQVEKLERDLTDARLALADSYSRVVNLEEALRETEIALRTVSSARLKSPASSPGNNTVDSRENDVKRQIENDALKEYIGQRM